ncbi:hypothetical protein [Streptomyces sp. NPDC006334]|uniref:hypothetical protein n=1 Tax=Streptomyces sp. NPDC006334 TaxID=3156754 RepID=UPI0033B3DA3A
MTDQPWAVHLSPQAAKTLTELPAPAKEMVRDVLDIVVRSPVGLAPVERQQLLNSVLKLIQQRWFCARLAYALGTQDPRGV